MNQSNNPRLRRLLAPATLALLVAASGSAAAAQVAPTLPSDTLGGRRLPAEANVPRTVVAPTLPRDTLAAPVTGGTDSITPPVPTTPRLPAPSDTTPAADSAAARDSVAPRDSAAPRAPQVRPVPQPASPRRLERLRSPALPRLTLA